MKFQTLIVVVIFCCTTLVSAVPVFRVADFGAKGDGITDDSVAIRATIAAAIRAGPAAVVQLDGKRYRLTKDPANSHESNCINVHIAKGITIQGVAGATELISSDPQAGLLNFYSCTNAVVRGITIDYDPVPFIQGGITAVDVTQGTFDMQVDEGFPSFEALKPPEMTFEKIIGKWGVIFERASRQFKPGTPSVVSIKTYTPLDNRRCRLELHDHHAARTLAVGDVFVMRAGAEGHAMAFWGCHGALVEDVTIYAAASLCVALVQCKGDLVVRRVRVCRRPNTTRLLSGNADGIHCQSLRKGPRVEQCHFEGMTDDGINIYDRPRVVTRVISATELCVQHTFAMRPGDRIQVMDPHTGQVRGEADVTAVPDQRHIVFSPPIEGIRTSTNILSGITSIPNCPDADVVFNLSTCGAGYIVRNNYFGNFRGRGVLVKGVEGLVESNVIERTSGPGIVIANEPTWPEGPVPRDVVVRGNRLNAVGLDGSSSHMGAIMIAAMGLKGTSEYSGIKNVRVENNLIVNPPAVGLWIHACAGVRLISNRIESDGSRMTPSSVGVSLADCTNVVVDRLTMKDLRPHTRCAVEIQTSVAAGESGVKISGLNTQLAPTAVPVLDHRR